MIHVPMLVKDKYKIVARSVPGLRKTLGRDPTAEELADQVFIDTDSKVRFGSVVFCSVRFGSVLFCSARFGSVRFDLI